MIQIYMYVVDIMLLNNVDIRNRCLSTLKYPKTYMLQALLSFNVEIRIRNSLRALLSFNVEVKVRCILRALLSFNKRRLTFSPEFLGIWDFGYTRDAILCHGIAVYNTHIIVKHTHCVKQRINR